MALDNLIEIEFTDDELRQIDAHLNGLEAIFKPKVVQLTPKESQRYGKLGNERENWVNMIHADTKTATDLVPTFVNRPAWDKDEKARDQLSPRATRLDNLNRQVTDTNRLIGFDIYNTCNSVYQNARFLSTKNAPGSKAYYEKWKQQFEQKGSGDDSEAPKQP